MKDSYFISRKRGKPDKPRDLALAKSARGIDVSRLTLSRAVRNREGEWPADDYDVFDGEQQIGRIVLTMKAPQGMPWYWAITARPDSTQNRGYAVSREQAMKELKARWANPSRF
jgi:hypothetical protein